MELKQIKYFDRVAKMGSVSKAAASLSVAQPAISRQIAQLESELGVPLFYRNGRGVTLTEAGAMFSTRAEAILDHMVHAEQEIRDLRKVISGTVSLGLPPTAAQVLAIPLIAKLQALHPKLALTIREGFSGHVHEWLSFGELDIAVLYDAPRGRQLVTEELVHEHLCLISNEPAPDDAVVRFRDLPGIPLILPTGQHGLRLLIDKAAVEASVSLHPILEVDALSVIKELVETGVGATILPEACMLRERTAGLVGVRRIVEPPMARTLVLTTSSQRPLTNATRAVIVALKEVVRGLVEEHIWQGAY